MQERVRRLPGRMQGCQAASITDGNANAGKYAFTNTDGANSNTLALAIRW